MKIDGLSLEEYFEKTYPAQCLRGTKWILNRMRELNPRVYMEIGCGYLSTFRMYESLLPPAPAGLAIGLDNRPNNELWDWNEYVSHSGCSVCLFECDSTDPTNIEKVSNVLNGRMIDYLFIDGWHGVEAVVADYENYHSFVRTGGIVAFHDVDFLALDRGDLEGQGGAFMTRRLQNEGYNVEVVPDTCIGTTLVTMK